MDAPSPSEVRARSPYLASRFPEEKDDELLVWIEDATALVASLTCRAIGPSGTPGEDVPAYLVPLAMRAITMKTERLVSQLGSLRERRSSVSSGNLRGFRAGSYAEDYFGPDEAAKAKQLDPDQQTHEILWAITTEACREAWLELWDPANFTAPASAVSAFDWNQRPGGY